MYIKVKFLKNSEPRGREYTYKATFPVRVGQEVILPGGGNGVVTEINVPEESVAAFSDKVKELRMWWRKASNETKPMQILCFIHENQIWTQAVTL